MSMRAQKAAMKRLRALREIVTSRIRRRVSKRHTAQLTAMTGTQMVRKVRMNGFVPMVKRNVRLMRTITPAIRARIQLMAVIDSEIFAQRRWPKRSCTPPGTMAVTSSRSHARTSRVGCEAYDGWRIGSTYLVSATDFPSLRALLTD